MKRYRQVLDRNLDGDYKAKMYITKHGEWVKWEDVKDIIWIPCNCAEKAFMNDSRVMPDNVWICPAHGYKRR